MYIYVLHGYMWWYICTCMCLYVYAYLNIYICMYDIPKYIYIGMYVYTYLNIFLSSVCWKGQENKSTTITMSTQWPDLVSNTIPHQRNLGSLEKWLILGLEQGKSKISLKHLVILKGKEWSIPRLDGDITRIHEQLKETHISCIWDNFCAKNIK